MDYEKLIEQCEAELKKAQEENKADRIEELEKELQRLNYELQWQREYDKKQREHDEDLATKVKPKQVLSEYFLKKSRLRNLSTGLLRELSETFLREPAVTDEHGTYKPGYFTHKRCIVVVEKLEEDGGLWRLHIMSEEQIPDSIVWEIRDRFVPDRCPMVRFYGSRGTRLHGSEVILLEFPGQVQEISEE